MRCSEARRRLSERRPEQTMSNDDRDLRHHLEICPDCRRHAAAEQSLARDLQTVARTDGSDGLPLSVLKTRVEAMAADTRTQENSIMATIFNTVRTRPRLGVTVAAVCILVALATLIPFKFERTIGYEVAVAGVAPDVALDQSKLQALLHQLGVDEAEVDITGCTETCNLIIRSLKTSKDAHLIAAAFSNDGSHRVNTDIKEITAESPTSLAGEVKHTIDVKFISEDSNEPVEKILIERLGEESGGNAFFWLRRTDGEKVGATLELVEPGDSMALELQGNAIFFNGSEVTTTDSPKVFINQRSGDGHSIKMFNMARTEDGDHTFSLDATQFNDSLLNVLRDQGYTVSADTIDGVVTVRIEGGMHGATLELQQGEEAAAKEGATGELPDGYALEQNYPNPFNPTTTIEFSIPQNEHVTLEIFNIQGQKVRTLIDEPRGAGEHVVVWDARNDNGAAVASGVYLYRLTAGEQVATKKMSFLK